MSLEVRNLTKQFAGIKALNNCTLKVKEGSITSLIGPNGAGKTTLFNIITGFESPTSGSIIFKGSNITKLPAFKRAQLGISRNFQQVRLFRNLSIKDNLLLAGAGTYNLEELHLKIPLSRLSSELSYGQQRLVEIARSYLKPYSLLMLDEPTSGVNPVVRRELRRILLRLKKNHQTVFFIEHDMDFVMDVSDHVIVLNEGSVLAQGTPNKIRNDKRVLTAYLGGR